MISNIPQLVTKFSDYLVKIDYVGAYSFAVKNNLLFSHIGSNGYSCADYVDNILQTHIRMGSTPPTESFIKHVTPLLDYFLTKEPHYCYYKRPTNNGKNEAFIFLLSYMVFNNSDKVQGLLSNMDKDSVTPNILKSNYLYNRKIDFNMLNVIEKALLPEKITLTELINIQHIYPDNFHNSFTIYDHYKKNNKITYKHEEAIKLFTYIFDRRIENTLVVFIETFTKTIEFLKPLLLKNYTGGYSEKIIKRYYDLFREVFYKSIDPYTNTHTLSFNRSYIVPALQILAKQFPEIHINS